MYWTLVNFICAFGTVDIRTYKPMPSKREKGVQTGKVPGVL